jgi:signal peptidase II
VRLRAWLTIATIALAIVALDQGAKAWVTRAIGPDQPRHERDLLGSWLSLDYVQNRGTAFGLFSGGGPLVPALVAVGFLIFAFAVWRTARPSGWFMLAAGLIAGGASGNAIDRIRDGYVTYYVAVSVWWRFNVADSAVTIGMILLIFLSMRTDLDSKGWMNHRGEAPEA